MTCDAPRFPPGPRQRHFSCQASQGVRAFSTMLLKTPTPAGESRGLPQTPPATEGQRAVPGRELQGDVGGACGVMGLAPRPISAARNPEPSSVSAGVPRPPPQALWPGAGTSSDKTGFPLSQTVT